MPVVAAMPPMLQELARDKESGYLGHYAHFGLRGPILIQYWRTPEDVYRFATDRDATHQPAWSAFNARARRLPGAVGIWHETYQIARAETVVCRHAPNRAGSSHHARADIRSKPPGARPDVGVAPGRCPPRRLTSDSGHGAISRWWV